MTARLSDGHQSIGTPKKGYGLARDFSMARYDGFANAFMAAKAHKPDGWTNSLFSYDYPLRQDSKGRFLPHAPECIR